MTTFKPQVWSDDDPDYAPCIGYRSNGYPRWKCPPRYIAAGFSLKEVPLRRGFIDDGHHQERALKCRELTRELLRWWDGLQNSRPAPHSIKWLIARYLSDEFSPFQSVKGNTQASYRQDCAYWENAAGNMLLADMDFVTIKGIEAAMRKKGRTDSFIHRKFTMLRMLVSYGKLIKAEGARDLRDTLSEMRFRSAAKRSSQATREQVYAVAARAWRAGQRHFAVGCALTFEMSLRAVDVRGQWLPTDEREGGIVRNGQRWQDGLTWDCFAPDFWSFSKVISKTEKTMPDPIEFSLRSLPKLRRRLMALAAPESRVGPVFVISKGHDAGMPYMPRGWAAAWRRFAREAGVPDSVWMMDMRAGAISEADRMGASREQLSQAAQHADIATTGRYVRNRSDAAAKVIELRQRNRL